MSFLFDITNQKFRRWTAVNFSHIKNEKHFWNCVCECGVKKKVEKSTLRSGRSRSCGCLHHVPWTKKEIKFLQLNYGLYGAAWCSKKIPRSKSVIAKKAGQLKLKIDAFWTDEEIKILKLNYAVKGAEWCSKKIGRSIGTIQGKASSIKLKQNFQKNGSFGHRYWNFDRCLEKAKIHNTLTDWARNGKGYSYAQRMGFLDEIKALVGFEIQGNLLRRYVYAYEFSDKSVYVGITCNLENRHASHLVSDRFTKEKKGIPFLKILLTKKLVDSKIAMELEEKYVRQYEKKSWVILNKGVTGGLGGGKLICTEENIMSSAKQCKTRQEFKINFPGCVKRARAIGIYDKATEHMVRGWTHRNDENLIKTAKNFKTIKDLKKSDYGAYRLIWKRKLQKVAFNHMG